MNQPLWPDTLVSSRKRPPKPRRNGLTMVIDKGLGLSAFCDLLQLAGEYIDFLKLGFGTAGVTPPEILRKKIALARQSKVSIYPGGTFLEIAHARKKLQPYLKTLAGLGFEWIEVSDGLMDFSPAERSRLIRLGQKMGFRVITEIGKKASGIPLDLKTFADVYERDREAGAAFVIVEGRESGKNVGIYDENGQIRRSMLEFIRNRTDPDTILWEAPQTHQQIQLLHLLGPKANLGNISPHDILSLECLRRGLRADTFHPGDPRT
jgi:phosphosulfolactate synthase